MAQLVHAKKNNCYMSADQLLWLILMHVFFFFFSFISFTFTFHFNLDTEKSHFSALSLCGQTGYVFEWYFFNWLVRYNNSMLLHDIALPWYSVADTEVINFPDSLASMPELAITQHVQKHQFIYFFYLKQNELMICGDLSDFPIWTCTTFKPRPFPLVPVFWVR